MLSILLYNLVAISTVSILATKANNRFGVRLVNTSKNDDKIVTVERNPSLQ